MEVEKIYKEILLSKLIEIGFKIRKENDNTFRLNLNDLNSLAIKLIVSEPIIERLHGTKNNTPIQAIGYFRFKFPRDYQHPNFYIFALSNINVSNIQFVIVPSDELIYRFKNRNFRTDNEQLNEFKLWHLPDGQIFDATNLGTEGEYWFIGGKMAEDTIMDYTNYLNNWVLIK